MKRRSWPNILVALTALLAMVWPFSGWAQFNYTNINGTITITSYTGSGGNVTIPSSINGYPVTVIGDTTFGLKFNLMSVTIPDSVTSIGNGAFVYCYSMTNVTIPDSVTSIGYEAFNRCSGLSSITIPNSVTGIGAQTFQYSGLISVTIGNSVTNIGYEAFDESPLLASVTIPNSVTSISDLAFNYCTGLTNLTIGNNLASIGSQVFYHCSRLISVTIPNSVTSIGDYAFGFCSGLTNMMMPSSITNVGIYAFENCANLHQMYFQGSAPGVDGGAGSADSTVFHAGSGTAYFVPGTTGWGATFGSWPTAGWYQPQPEILGSGLGLGAQSSGFQFTISWATNASVVIESSTNLLNWTATVTNPLVSGTNTFSDPAYTNYPKRFYRVRSQ